jgi:NAD(P)-dependent dehydrogenase (short-subunit alcohol dehydrogenase family)
MKVNNKWASADIPDLKGSIVMITGANSGLGYHETRAIAEKGATAVMGCRDMAKGESAAKKIKETVPGAKLVLMHLDLASLKSIRSFADEFKKRYDRLDILINNAGVMAPPYGTTEDGFELQIGTNHFGHFALTGLLLDRILRTPKSRVVSVSSLVHRMGRINFDDINSQEKYSKWPAYGQSKLANLLFIYELDRRLKNAGSKVIAAAAHPGYSNTNLQRTTRFFSFFNPLLAQPAAMGALPTLYAATEEHVQGGAFYGPNGFFEMRGYPRKTDSNAPSHDRTVAARLWDLSEKATGVKYSFTMTAAPAALKIN